MPTRPDTGRKTFPISPRAIARKAATRAGHLPSFGGAQDPAVLDRAGAGTLSPNGNGVSLETEMVKAADVKREHDMALAIYSKSLAILRASLGRR